MSKKTQKQTSYWQLFSANVDIRQESGAKIELRFLPRVYLHIAKGCAALLLLSGGALLYCCVKFQAGESSPELLYLTWIFSIAGSILVVWLVFVRQNGVIQITLQGGGAIQPFRERWKSRKAFGLPIPFDGVTCVYEENRDDGCDAVVVEYEDGQRIALPFTGNTLQPMERHLIGKLFAGVIKTAFQAQIDGPPYAWGEVNWDAVSAAEFDRLYIEASSAGARFGGPKMANYGLTSQYARTIDAQRRPMRVVLNCFLMFISVVYLGAHAAIRLGEFTRKLRGTFERSFLMIDCSTNEFIFGSQSHRFAEGKLIKKMTSEIKVVVDYAWTPSPGMGRRNRVRNVLLIGFLDDSVLEIPQLYGEAGNIARTARCRFVEAGANAAPMVYIRNNC